MTDNTQASEDVLIELATKFDMDEYGTVNENGGYLIGEVRKLIRTEKLKLLAEVRERVIEQAKPDKRKATSWQQGIEVAAYEDAVRVYEYKMNEQLTKLEAEL